MFVSEWLSIIHSYASIRSDYLLGNNVHQVETDSVEHPVFSIWIYVVDLSVIQNAYNLELYVITFW